MLTYMTNNLTSMRDYYNVVANRKFSFCTVADVVSSMLFVGTEIVNANNKSSE